MEYTHGNQDVINLNHTDKKHLIAGIVLLGAFLCCYFQAFSELIFFWKDSYVYSYGFLIPLISIYLLWLNREKLKRIDPVPSYTAGFLLFTAGLLIYIFGNRSGVFVVQSLSIIITISGIVLFVFGKKFFLASLFPIAYLLFMIPLWDSLTERLQFPFQIFTAFTASQLLNLSGIPVYRHTVFLDLPNITLKVATVCSGINNLIAVCAIALPLAHISLKSWPRRIILVSAGIIIAAFSNGLRVAMIGLFAYKGIFATLHGPGHILQAMFVSFVGFIVLFIGAWILSEKHPKIAASSVSNRNPAEGIDTRDHIRIKNHSLYLTAGLLFTVGIYINFFSPSPVPLKTDLKFFPYEIGPYKGADVATDHTLSDMFDPDSTLSRVYRTDSGREVNLYIGYLESQAQGKELVNYKSAKFHNGASRQTIAITPEKTIEINEVLSQKDGTPRITYFWYDLNGSIIADRYYAKVQTALSAITKSRTNGTVVMVSAGGNNTGDGQNVSKDMEDFIRILIPVLHSYLP